MNEKIINTNDEPVVPPSEEPTEEERLQKQWEDEIVGMYGAQVEEKAVDPHSEELTEQERQNRMVGKMHEAIFNKLEERARLEQAQWEDEIAGMYEEQIKEKKEALAKEEEIECGPLVAEFKEMLTAFEANHSLEELLAITVLAEDEAPQHPVREPARVDLIPLYEKLKAFEKTNISPKELGALDLQLKKLSDAVGYRNSNNNIVEHVRPR